MAVEALLYRIATDQQGLTLYWVRDRTGRWSSHDRLAQAREVIGWLRAQGR